MDDRSKNGAVSEAAPPADRVGSLSARLSEALTAVGIAVRRREAEIELIDRTLAASSDAQSAAARQAADRMARVRAEHADELQLMQRARHALEDASAVAGELSLELESRRGESEEAVREADNLRRSLAASEIEHGELRARLGELESQAASLSEDLEQARRALAAREAELEQVWRELDVKTREAQELGRLMAAFTPGMELGGGDAPVNGVEAEPAAPPANAVDAADPASSADEEPAILTEAGGEREGDVSADDDDDAPAPPPSPVVEDALDPLPATPSVEHMSAAAFDLLPATTDAAADALTDDLDVGDDDPPAPPDASDLDDDGAIAPLPRFAEAPDVDLPAGVVHDVMDELGEMPAPPPSAPDDAADAMAGDDDDALVLDEEAEAPAEASADDADDAAPDAGVDISVDDWGAVLEDEPAVALPPPTPPGADRAAIDGELRAYLSDGDGDDAPAAAPPTASPAFSPDALFKATSGISDFRCATPDEVRLAGALQLQSWRPSELAQLLGIEETVVREKLESYHERGLVEVVSG